MRSTRSAGLPPSPRLRRTAVALAEAGQPFRLGRPEGLRHKETAPKRRCYSGAHGGTVRRTNAFLCALASVLWIAAVGAAGRPAQQSSRPAPRVDFDRQVRPIIEARCLECHSAEKRKGGLSLATYGDALDGGRNGAVIRPGNSTGSLIVQRLLGRVDPQMPKDEDPLPGAEIGLIRRWIDEGARETPTGPPAPPPWDAPLALTRPTVPPIVWAAWTAPTDRFIAAYLSDRACERAVDGGRRALRATRVPRYLGPPPVARGAVGLPEGDRRRQARAPPARAALRQPEIRRALDLVLERPAPQRGRRHLLLGDRRPQEHHRLAARVTRRQSAVRPVRRRSSSIRSHREIPTGSWLA